jgi:ankyrin repeat protein
MPSFNQITLMQQMQKFLHGFSYKDEKGVEQKEDLPSNWEKGFCNAFAFMMLRADRIGESDKHLQRLTHLADADEKKLKKMASLVTTYDEAFRAKTNPYLDKDGKKVLPDAMQSLAKKVAECKNQTEITEVRNKFFSELEKSIISQLSLSAEDNKLLAESRELYVFIQSFIFAFNPGVMYDFHVDGRYISQLNWEDIFNVLLPDKLIKKKSIDAAIASNIESKNDAQAPLAKAFSMFANINQAELIHIIEKSIKDQDYVSITSLHHGLYFKRDGQKYIFYDPNNKNKPEELSTVAQLAAKITNALYSFAYILPIEINAYKNPDVADNARPKSIDILKEIYTKRGFGRNAEDNRDILHTSGADKFTDLHLAADSNNIEQLNFLLKHGASYKVVSRNNQTPLLTAFSACNTEAFEILAKADPAFSINALRGGNPYLYSTIKMGNNLAMVETLIKLGADPAIDCNGDTPLALAANKGYIEIVASMLKSRHAVNINAIIDTRNDETLLMIAARTNNKMLIHLLLNHGADISVVNSKGQSALSLATDDLIIDLLTTKPTLDSDGPSVQDTSSDSGVASESDGLDIDLDIPDSALIPPPAPHTSQIDLAQDTSNDNEAASESDGLDIDLDIPDTALISPPPAPQSLHVIKEIHSDREATKALAIENAAKSIPQPETVKIQSAKTLGNK